MLFEFLVPTCGSESKMASQRRLSKAGTSDAGRQRKSPPKPKSTQPNSSFFRRNSTLLLLVFFVFSATTIFFYLHNNQQRQTDLREDTSSFSGGPISTDLSYKSVLLDHDKFVHEDRTKRHFNGSVLAYVTPWNSKGYEMAKLFRHKFTHISPVWYQLKCEEKVVLNGRHDVDQKWIESVRVGGSPMVLPRFTMEGSQMEDVLAGRDESEIAINIIVSECKTMHYDGVVFEAWNGWAHSGILDNPILRQKALNFVRDLGAALYRVQLPRPNRNMRLIFVIPPPAAHNDAKFFTRSDMDMLHRSVDGFSLMTYDYSNPYQPGPTAPLPWIHSCLHMLLGIQQKVQHSGGSTLASKILTGLNFYGNDFVLPSGGGPIIGHEYISLLKKHKPTFLWDGKAQEHYFQYTVGKKHIVFYPSLKSLYVRLEAARSWGTGISIWEIGQGLEYFFDLL